MATTASRAHLFNQLNRRATSSSPREEQDFATAASNTASSFDPARDAIHSTAQLPDYTTQQQLPAQHYLDYNRFPDHISDSGSEQHSEMSIELGRGVKRGARARDDDVSSNIKFNMGNDSLYEITGTPPIRARNSSHRKTDDGLRKQASIRRATETATSNGPAKRMSSVKSRSLSEHLRNINTDDDTSFMAQQNTATFNNRNTRFVSGRHASGAGPSSLGQQAARRSANNPTAQSNSFMLPDIPDITELVSGVRKDGTPRSSRLANSRSRFTSATYRPSTAPAQHFPIESVPIPEDEKAIYAALQVLKDRVEQLEMEKSKAAKRAEEYEGELIDLRTQLAVAQERPDSGLGSSASDDDGHAGQTSSRNRLQVSVKALQDRLDRSERKVSIAEITAKRVTNERDQLFTQIVEAHCSNAELKAEHEAIQEQQATLLQENEELKEEVDDLRKENQGLKILIRQTQKSYDDETRRSKIAEQWTSRSIKNATQEVLDRGLKKPEQAMSKKQQKDERRRSTGHFDQNMKDDLAARIAQEVQKNQKAAAATTKARASADSERLTRQQQAVASSSRSRSKSQSRQHAAPGLEGFASGSKREAPFAAVENGSDAESTTQLDFTYKSRTNASKRASLPAPIRPASAPMREEDSRDITLLSWQDTNELRKLRKKIEEEHRAKRLGETRAASAPGGTQTGLLQRKSSLKDVIAGSENGTGRINLDDFTKTAKSVRVQSPHTTDESIHHQSVQNQENNEFGDTGVLSNTSRRRHRRAASAEGMTSAFILPDITIHNSRTTINPQHDAGNCTACPPSNKEVSIPTPVPVTDRLEDVIDVTNATIRPSQSPPLALASVIKQLQDEIAHLKIQLAAQQRLYNQHDPALSKKRRVDVTSRMNKLTSEIDKRSDQVYALYDVLEGQKQAGVAGEGMEEQEVEETLQSLGIDPVELSGRIGRKAPFGIDSAGDISEDESEELPWEGLSDAGSEEVFRPERRRSGVF